MHTLFHIKTVIIPRDQYQPEGFSPRVDIGRGMMTVLIWKKHRHLFLVIFFLPRYYIYYKVRNRSFVKNLGHRDFRVFSTGAWGMDFLSSSPLFSTAPLFSQFSYKSFLFQNFHNHSFFLHLTISVDVIHHE